MDKLYYVLLLCVTMVACGKHSDNESVKLISKEGFESVIDGKDVSLYTLTNKSGITMQVTNYGARVVSLWTPDRDGYWNDIVLGFESIDRYVNNTGERFLGATIGRYGNRIANGRFALDGEEYQLSTFNNGQSLHGGDKGFDKVVWCVDSLTKNSIYFSYLSKDMEEGYPGNLRVKMSYTLTSDDEFVVEHYATTDKATPVNLTHHSFFNLKGEGNGTINSHILWINADGYIPVNEKLIPNGKIVSVTSTSFDFRTPKAIGKDLEQESEQFDNCSGYDHNFVLNRKDDNDLELSATVYEPSNGRYMEVWTTEPGLQFYGGNFFDGEIVGKSGTPLRYREAIALETQHFPDSPNQPQFPSTILRPNDEYRHTCIYKFKTK